MNSNHASNKEEPLQCDSDEDNKITDQSDNDGVDYISGSDHTSDNDENFNRDCESNEITAYQLETDNSQTQYEHELEGFDLLANSAFGQLDVDLTAATQNVFKCAYRSLHINAIQQSKVARLNNLSSTIITGMPVTRIFDGKGFVIFAVFLKKEEMILAEVKSNTNTVCPFAFLLIEENDLQQLLSSKGIVLFVKMICKDVL